MGRGVPGRRCRGNEVCALSGLWWRQVCPVSGTLVTVQEGLGDWVLSHWIPADTERGHRAARAELTPGVSPVVCDPLWPQEWTQESGSDARKPYQARTVAHVLNLYLLQLFMHKLF